MSHLSAVNLALKGLHTLVGWACRRTRCCCDRPTIFPQRRRCPSLKFTVPTDTARARNWQWSSLLNVNKWWPQTTHKLATAGSYAAHSEMLRTEQTRLGAKTLVLVVCAWSMYVCRDRVVPAQVEGHVYGRGDAGRQGDRRQSVQDQHRRSSRQQRTEGQGRRAHQGRHGQPVEWRHRQHRRSRCVDDAAHFKYHCLSSTNNLYYY